MGKLDRIKDKDGNLPTYAWPGGYPLFYLDGKDNVLCSKCANESEQDSEAYPEDKPTHYDANWEDPNLFCDACSERIESAYAEKDEDEDE